MQKFISVRMPKGYNTDKIKAQLKKIAKKQKITPNRLLVDIIQSAANGELINLK